MKEFRVEKRRIELLRKRQVKISKEIAFLDNKIQSNCKHPIGQIVEGDYIPDDSWSGGHSTPPFRVCKICGCAEEGWGCGYKLLGKGDYSGTIPIVKREEALKFVVTMHTQPL